MDSARFDAWIRSLGLLASRRTTLRGLLGAALVTPLAHIAIPGLADAKKKHKRKRKKRKRKKVTRNAFGCVDVGKFCQNGGQCCSGICQGKKDKKTCQAHDQSTCLAGQESCNGPEVDCITNTGEGGACNRTTGNASYCGADGECFACTKDADCVPFCGPQAACIVCSEDVCEEEGNTVCAGPSGDSCNFP